MVEHANTFLLVTILVLVTILLVFGMKYFSAARQAAARIASDDGFRDLAATTTAAQAETIASLASLRSELTEVKSRLSSIEKILKEVE
jgi:Tfp pilus assembly protein PilO